MCQDKLMKESPEDDLMERLIGQWAQERPELDASAMRIVGRIMRLGRQFEKDAALALKPLGLSYTEFDIIATLRRSGRRYELTPGQLGKAVLLTSGAMTAALDRLEQSGFITRHASDSDRRVKTARLTAAGKRIAVKAAEARFEVAKEVVDGLSVNQRSSLAKLLLELSLR